MFEVVEDTAAPLAPPPPPARPRARPVAKPVVASADEDDEDDRRGYGVSRSRDDDEDRPKPKKKKKPKWKRSQGSRSDNSGRSLEGHIINGGVIGGLLAMLIAVVWFVAGIFALDRIFFYPPILFVVGLIAFAKGLAGGSE